VTHRHVCLPHNGVRAGKPTGEQDHSTQRITEPG
jgi:hypothetical protein